MTCPSCHEDAPPIVRGVRAYCTACGAPRSIVDAPEAVNVAGQPHKVGGGIASVLGWVALGAGLILALFLGALVNLVFTFAAAAWVAGILGVFTLLVAVPLLLGGRSLNKTGEARSRAAQEQAVFGLASRRRGVLAAREVARSLSIREEDADSLLTDLAKRPDGRVSLEVDDDGGLSYLFHDLRPATAPRVRVAAEPWQAPAPRVQAEPPPPRVIDAELIDEAEEAPSARAVRHTVR